MASRPENEAKEEAAVEDYAGFVYEACIHSYLVRSSSRPTAEILAVLPASSTGIQHENGVLHVTNGAVRIDITLPNAEAGKQFMAQLYASLKHALSFAPAAAATEHAVPPAT